ncbi:hypothetical protein [Streptomyces sp. H27-S2]|uniref:hypothetical protein n=1 Tax=Streptomyces antarcticus TaxID=2996458 RepID=UPI002270562D|nr:hypothetical protein [Streptomyces sp. H27-S2]MCY0952979.1 hypothetical protein [Streptomyces sp. H27-S2]
MSVTAVHPAPALFLEPVATDRARHRVQELMTDFRSGAWTPTPLERRVAGLLITSTAVDGTVTGGRVRTALWEGNLTMIEDNGGRFASVLADLVPVLDEPELTALDVVDAAGELVTAVAGLG